MTAGVRPNQMSDLPSLEEECASNTTDRGDARQGYEIARRTDHERADEEPKNQSDRDFYSAQSHVGDPYFMYVIDHGINGGGSSCYFWFTSPAQLRQALRNHLDFWTWRDGLEHAERHVAGLLKAEPIGEVFTDALCAKLNDYLRRQAGFEIRAWGRFENLCNQAADVLADIRREFRETALDPDLETDQSLDAPITLEELPDFCDYLAAIPT